MAKKKKNSDFQKVKLRVGRQLPKGLNITDTSFSTRKIFLTKQLKDEPVAGPTTHRKLSLKDLLSRLDHYSPSTRNDSLTGLKELFNSSPTLIKSNLSSILEKSCQLIIDKDPTVRKGVLGVLKLVLKGVDSGQLSPFFPVLSSYLCCAMTHIVTGIRSDSLLFLDLLLESFPDLTVMSGNKIFQNFLDQISSERDPQSVEIGRRLLVNPGEKSTSQKWRTDVLRRMEKFLKASLECWDPSRDENPEPKVVVWDYKNSTGVSLYFRGHNKPLLDKVFSIYRWDVTAEGDVQLKDPEVLKGFISVLMPLLIETWVEASPSSLLFIHQGADPGYTMDCVLQVIKFLGECSEKVSKDGSTLKWFRKIVANDFQKHFMAWFPYAGNQSPPKKKRKAEYEEVSYVHLNLAVCEIFTLLPQNADSLLSVYQQRICEYLTQALSNYEISGVDDISAAVKVVRRLLPTSQVNEELLETLWWLCNHWPPERKDRMVIVDFFIEIVSGIEHRHLISCSAISSWLRSLPKEIILSSKSPKQFGQFLAKVKRFAVRRFPAFLQGLEENDAELVALFSNKLEDEVCSNLIVLCSLLPNFSLKTLRDLAEAVRNPKMAVKNVNFLLQALNFRFLHKTDLGCEFSEYLGFLQCIVVGLFKNEGNDLRQQYASNNEWCFLRQFLPPTSHFTLIPSDPHVFERHSEIISVVLNILLQYPNMTFLEKSVYSYINILLESLTHLPVHSVVAVMRLVTRVHTSCSSEDEDVANLLEKLHLNLASLTLDALAYCSCMRIVGRDGTVVDSLHDAIFSFVQISECGELICDLLFQQLQGQAGVSPEEAECVAGVVLQLLQSGFMDITSIQVVDSIIRNLQRKVELDGSESWWKDLRFEWKLRYQRIVARHKKQP